ncbi:MAG TPA: NAD(P)H-dependent oxidoreductase [Hyphomonadaceae bacterium]|nr:NAD(P)H-dependent oxidoreductase [Hyphomonadaceae bacterium]
MTRKIAVVVGSLRNESNSARLARAIAAEAPKNLTFEVVEIGDLPFYNQDLETAAAPAAWTRFRSQINSADAVLFVTPEFNRSVPGALKNAIDVGSRPYGASAWAGKPAAVVSSSVGPISGFGANHHLRQSLAFLDMPTLQQPEMYLGSVGDWFDAEGKVKNADTRTFLGTFAKKFADWIELTAPRAQISQAS